jgi:exosortase E/protease (VPEID-CTERM system)
MGQLTDAFWVPLSRSTFWVVRGLLGLVTADCVCDPLECVIGTPTFAVRISPECSGYEGIGLVWVFVVVYLWSDRHELRFPAALLLLPAATAVIWLANALRIAVLIALGTRVSAPVALGGFHSQAGWLAFTLIALGVVVVARSVPGFSARPDPARPAVAPDATTAYLAPLLVLLTTMMVTGALTAGFEWLYSVRVVLTGVALWYFRRPWTTLRWGWSWTAAGLGVAGFVLWLALEPARPPDAGEAFAAALAGADRWAAAGWLVFRVLGAVVTVPLAEELAFRGFLTRRLIAPDFEAVPPGRFTWLSFLLSSLLFGLLHGRWLAGTLAGMAYALAVYRRGRLSDAVLAHALTDARLAAYVLATGSWWLW